MRLPIKRLNGNWVTIKQCQMTAVTAVNRHVNGVYNITVHSGDIADAASNQQTAGKSVVLSLC